MSLAFSFFVGFPILWRGRLRESFGGLLPLGVRYESGHVPSRDFFASPLLPNISVGNLDLQLELGLRPNRQCRASPARGCIYHGRSPNPPLSGSCSCRNGREGCC